MKEIGCNNFFCSARVYGLSNKSDITENSPLNPINLYFKNKETIEKMLGNFFKALQNIGVLQN